LIVVHAIDGAFFLAVAATPVTAVTEAGRAACWTLTGAAVAAGGGQSAEQ